MAHRVCRARARARPPTLSYSGHRAASSCPFHYRAQIQYNAASSIRSTKVRAFIARSYHSSDHLGPLSRYNEMVASGKLRPDIRQEKTMVKLQHHYDRIIEWAARNPQLATQSQSQSASELSGSSWSSRLSSLFHRSNSAPSSSSSASSALPGGLYMYGGVGCGKTMMMNLFYDSLPANIPKSRHHFHEFMLGIHSQLHQFRQSGNAGSDPLVRIAKLHSLKSRVLCFDEFQVTDVADAMILKVLFESLWSLGVCIVSTSNRDPDSLYKNGINREVFLPFIAELKQNCEIHPMEEGQDHRLLGTMDRGLYHYPLNDTSEAEIQAIFQSLSLNETPTSARIKVMMGRELTVPLASRNAALFDFDDLCAQPLSAADYIAVANVYQYVIVKNIPVLSLTADREKIRRFITLLDVFYERGTRLIVSADAKPAQLFSAGDGKTGASAVYDEGFAASRAVSRLIEMQSEEYSSRHAQRTQQNGNGNDDE